ncbi:MAG: GatB/YqeY domain-containing protein [Gemmatimonadaceae bacterium]|nr:GatB/YqeY domain-containing protein [Gemmatimonadaceae bacterium]
MSELLARIQRDALAARKAQERAASLLLGTLLSEMKNKEIELRRALTDEDAVDVVRKALKRRREAVEAFTKGARPELAEREANEASALEAYLPPAIDPAEVRAAVRAAIEGGATAIGAVMGKVVPRFKGQVDGAVLSAIVKEELAAPR